MPYRGGDGDGDHRDHHREQWTEPGQAIEQERRPQTHRHVGYYRAPAERRHIAATRQIDADGILVAKFGVIAIDGPAQPGRLDPHDRIDLRIELGVAPEDFNADRIGLDTAAVAREHRFDDEAKESAELRRAAEDATRGHAVDLCPNFVRARHFAGRLTHRLDTTFRPRG